MANKDKAADGLDRDIQKRLDKEFLKDKPTGLSDGEYLMRGSTAKWKRGKYRKQAEAQEAKQHKAYRNDDLNVKAGNSPIEGTKEEYIRRDQVADKLAALKKRSKGIRQKSDSAATTKRVQKKSSKRTPFKRAN